VNIVGSEGDSFSLPPAVSEDASSWLDVAQPRTTPPDSSPANALLGWQAQAALPPAENHMLSLSVDRDADRFHKILRGKVREELGKYIEQGELITRKGEDVVSVPIPGINLPRFVHGKNEESSGKGKSGNGKGGSGDPQQSGAGGGAGDQSSKHMLEVEVSIEELAEILGEELELPRIEPKGKSASESERPSYNGVSRNGPDSLIHPRRSFREALKREIASGNYDPDDPSISFEDEDFRFRYPQTTPDLEANAVIFHIMDVSGSMESEQKDIARAISFWTDAEFNSKVQHLKGDSK